MFLSRYGITLCSDFGPPVEHASAISFCPPPAAGALRGTVRVEPAVPAAAFAAVAAVDARAAAAESAALAAADVGLVAAAPGCFAPAGVPVFPPIGLINTGCTSEAFACFDCGSIEFNSLLRSVRNWIPFASMIFSGFVIKSIAPYSIACIVMLASSFARELTTTTVARIFSFCSFCRSSSPFILGMLISKSTAS